MVCDLWLYGILSNDNYNIEIKKNAKVNVTTQGYQQLFTMAVTASLINFNITLIQTPQKY